MATPTRFPQDKMSVHANFGTVVESCSKKVAASPVWASADFPDGRGGDSANSAAVFLPLILTKPHNAKLTEIYGNFFIFFSFPTSKTAKNGCKKTGNLFLISCFALPFVAAVIRLSFPGSELVAHA